MYIIQHTADVVTDFNNTTDNTKTSTDIDIVTDTTKDTDITTATIIYLSHLTLQVRVTRSVNPGLGR